MKKMNPILRTLFCLSLSSFIGVGLSACPGTADGDSGDDDEDHQEEITRVVVNVTDSANASQVFTWDNAAGDMPTIDTITLAADETYDIEVEFWNDLEEPAEDVTQEIEEENTEHQLFFFGDDVGGDAADLLGYAYGDMDADGLPVGLVGELETRGTGTGELRTMLRHLPAEDGTIQKVAGLAGTLETDGTAGLPGDVDVDITFGVEVE